MTPKSPKEPDARIKHKGKTLDIEFKMTAAVDMRAKILSEKMHINVKSARVIDA